jgi:hypothetical protein
MHASYIAVVRMHGGVAAKAEVNLPQIDGQLSVV